LREDSRVDVFWVALSLLVVASTLDGAFRRGADNPNWDLRWRALDAAGRARVVTAAQSRASSAEIVAPDELDERELVAGYRRRRRRLSYLGLATSPLIAAASVLALTGVISGSTAGFVLTVVLLFSSAWEYLGKRSTNSKLRAVVDAEATAQ
jgi:hypothetical protein